MPDYAAHLPLMMLALSLALFLSLVMLAAGWLGWRTQRSGYIDSVWSFATGAAGVMAALAAGGVAERRILVAAMAGVWGLRLGTYLLGRSHGGDDPRYAALKAQWGDAARRKLFIFMQAQAIAALPLVLTIALAAGADRAVLDWRDYLGAAILLAGLATEALADAQLARFKADPAHHGQICDRGLWALCRHPNYFGEWLVWWGFVVIAFGLPWGWCALIAPLEMYWLLVHRSGIPLLEAHLAQSRPEAFAAYQARVPAFFPKLF